jgi:DNA-binding HxlR family transcriptional regulator
MFEKLSESQKNISNNMLTDLLKELLQLRNKPIKKLENCSMLHFEL